MFHLFAICYIVISVIYHHISGPFLFLFVYKNVYHTYSHMLLFPPLFIATLFHTSSDMRLAFLYTDFSAFHPITVGSFYHVVQPYFMYLYTGNSHLVRNNTGTLLHTCAPSHSNISLASCILRWSPLSRLYLHILFTLVFTLFHTPNTLLQ